MSEQKDMEEQVAQLSGLPSDLIAFDLRALMQFKSDGPAITVLSDTGAARTVLFNFTAGQELIEHSTTSQIMVHVLRGRVAFTTPGGTTTVSAGTLLQLEANVPHSVVARTNAAMLLTLTPSPQRHSLESSAFAGRVPLVTRVGDR